MMWDFGTDQRRVEMLNRNRCSVIMAVMMVMLGIGPASGRPDVRLSSLTPSRGPVGTAVALHGSGFTERNTVHFGPGGKPNLASTENGTRIVHTIPRGVGPCDLLGPNCKAPMQLVRPGLYPVSVTNARGRSNSLPFEVTN